MTVLLDTNILVDYLRRHRLSMEYVDRLNRKPSVSIVTVAELFAGASSQREEKKISILLDGLHVLAANSDVAKRAGAFVRLYRASHDVGLADALIAATAEHHRLDLATLNVKHFPMFKRLKPAY